MSDYFGALMRSSALRVGPGSAATGQPLTAADPDQGANDTARAGRSSDFIELDVEREAGRPDPEQPARRAPMREPAVEFLETSSPPGWRHDESRARSTTSDLDRNGEPLDFGRLQRAAIDAALSWVAADPAGARLTAPGSQAPSVVPSRPPADSIGAAEQRTPAVEATGAQPSEAIFARTAQEGMSLAELEVGSRQNSPVREAASLNAWREPAAPVVEDVVEISIGAIHVHVDAAPSRSAASRADARGADGRRDRPRNSSLERRYLRPI